MMVTLNHTWSQPGTYTIRVKARDTNSLESSWTSLEMTIGGPVLELEMKGGLGITVIINNTGTADATNITWDIALEGGLVIPHQITGTIQEIPIDEQFTVRPWVFGLGKKTITVSLTADDGVTAEKIASGFFLMFIVFGVK